MNSISKFIDNLGHLFFDHQDKIIASLLTIGILWLLRKMVFTILKRRHLDVQQRYKWRKNVQYVVYVTGIILVGQIWVEEFSSLSNFLGLVAAGIAIALRDPIVNLAGWAFLVWRKPFKVGDRVQIGEHAGDVIDIRPFQFVLLEIGKWVDADQPTGRTLLIPNSRIFSSTLANYDHEVNYIFHEIRVMITFESNWKKAKGLLREVLDKEISEMEKKAEAGMKRLTLKFVISDQNLSSSVYTRVESSGVMLTVRYPCPPRQRRFFDERVWEGILDAFAGAEDIQFAYPTQRFYMREQIAVKEGSGQADKS
jgi:small-conductance mechanosensitive channel